jgi:hypothetical protein
VSPTIRVDDEVYRALQARAEPFVDTPNTVLRRLLQLSNEPEAGMKSDEEPATPQEPRAGKPQRPKSSRSKAKRTRAPSGTLLPQEEYEIPLLQALEERGGRGAAADVIATLGTRLNGKLQPNDYATLDSGALRWQNRAQFVRYELVQRGDMTNDSPRGVWEISEQGRRRLINEG